MSKKNGSSCIELALRALVASALILSQTAWAGQNQKAQDNADSARKAGAQPVTAKVSPAPTVKTAATEEESAAAQAPLAKESASGGGRHEGIKVHGHWTIEVRNPDGALVTHREFENALSSVTSLPTLLSRKAGVGFWFVLLEGPSGTSLCQAGSALCGIYESAAPAPVNGTTLQYNNLQLSEGGVINGLSTLATQLILSGTAVAVGSSSIVNVQTQLTNCPTTVAPANAAANAGACQGWYTFTLATLASPVPVSVGQTIAVTVTISFS